MRTRIKNSAALFGLFLCGCSLLDGPDPASVEGTVGLRLVRSAPKTLAQLDGAAAEAFARAVASTDSIQVSVYPPGTGRVPEARRGAFIPLGQDTTELLITVVAENNKRVAVELFESDRLVFFGVDEDVDVEPNATTEVAIKPAPFEMAGAWTEPAAVGEGIPFALKWKSVTGASAYYVQKSVSNDFSTFVDTTVTDTVLNETSTAGGYFYRVRAENAYTKSEFTPTNFVHVYGPPEVTNVSDLEVVRHQTIRLSGVDLDYPETEVFLGKSSCNIVGATASHLDIQVPADATSGLFRVTNDLGTDLHPNLCRVSAIAYVTGSSTELLQDTTAVLYKLMIDAYAGIDSSSVTILPYDWVPGLDLSVFDLIIVGQGTWERDKWVGGDPTVQAQVTTAIATSGANVLGIGFGGAAYYEALGGSALRLTNATYTKQSFFVVWDQTASVYRSPNDLGVAQFDLVNAYSVVDTMLGIIMPGPQSGVTRIGAQTVAGTVFPLIDEIYGAGPSARMHFLWGFAATPLALTKSIGQNLFENVVFNLYEDGFSRRIVPAGTSVAPRVGRRGPPPTTPASAP